MPRIWIEGYQREGRWVEAHWRRQSDLAKVIAGLDVDEVLKLPDGVEVHRGQYHQGGFIVTGGPDEPPETFGISTAKDASIHALNRSARHTNPRALGGERKFDTYVKAAKAERAKERRVAGAGGGAGGTTAVADRRLRTQRRKLAREEEQITKYEFIVKNRHDPGRPPDGYRYDDKQIRAFSDQLKRLYNRREKTKQKIAELEQPGPPEPEPDPTPSPVRNRFTVRAQNFKHLTDELDVVASEELQEPLRQIREDGSLDLEGAIKLRDYLRDETGSAGVLTREHMREAGQEARKARRIEGQALRLRDFLTVQTEGGPTPGPGRGAPVQSEFQTGDRVWNKGNGWGTVDGVTAKRVKVRWDNQRGFTSTITPNYLSREADPEKVEDRGQVETRVAPRTRIPREIQDAVRRLVKAADGAHGFPPGLHEVRLHRVKARDKARGRYWPGSNDIGVRSDARDKTIAHEIGHWLDYQFLGSQKGSSQVERISASATVNAPYRSAHSAYKGEAAWGVMDAIFRSRSYRMLQDHYNSGGKSRHTKYLLRSRELFARAYAQWLAEVSNNFEMKRSLESDAPQGRAAAGVMTPYHTQQWDEDDFAPIKQAFDELFASWLN